MVQISKFIYIFYEKISSHLIQTKENCCSSTNPFNWIFSCCFLEQSLNTAIHWTVYPNKKHPPCIKLKIHIVWSVDLRWFNFFPGCICLKWKGYTCKKGYSTGHTCLPFKRGPLLKERTCTLRDKFILQV